MRVSDIYEDSKRACGSTDQTTVFGFISDAIETLSNKGSWDCRKVYLALPISSSNLVTLPSFVDSVLKANFHNPPSRNRDRIYEFSLNGPGSSAQRTDYSWEDRGLVPTLVSMS